MRCTELRTSLRNQLLCKVASKAHPLPSAVVESSGFSSFEQTSKKCILSHRRAITNDDEFVLCPGHGYVHSPVFLQKTDFPGRVASRQRNKNHIPLLALERIDRRTFDASSQVDVASARTIDVLV